MGEDRVKMSDRCPTCGQLLPIDTAEALVAAMQIPPPADSWAAKGNPKRGILPQRTRDVYEVYRNGKVPTGRFYVTYSGGEATRTAVEDALARGLIRRKCEGMWCLSEE